MELAGSYAYAGRTGNVVRRRGGLDDSPHVSRRLPDVLTAQGGTIEIEHTRRPVMMAGANEMDPYKD